MKKNIRLLLIIFFFTSSCYAESVRLTCSIELEKRSSEGEVRRENVIATVIVDYEEDFKSITIKTHKILAIAGPPGPDTISFVDRSDRGRWELREITKFNGATSSAAISIDRNSGVISYEDKFRDSTGFLNTAGAGNCVKLDPAIRKF